MESSGDASLVICSRDTDDEQETQLTEDSVEASSSHESNSASLDVQSNARFFQLAEYTKAIRRNLSGGGIFRKLFVKCEYSKLHLTLDDMLRYQQEPLSVPLLTSSANLATKALKMFTKIQRFLNKKEMLLTSDGCLKMIQKLLRKGLKRLEMKDELYMQVLKQSRNTENQQLKIRIWILFYALASTMPPSKLYVPLLTQYLQEMRQDQGITPETKGRVNGTWGALKKTVRIGARLHLPSLDEIRVLLASDRMKTSVYFLDGSFESVFYGVSTAVMDVVEQIAQIIGLKNYQTFSLFKSTPDGGDHVALEDDTYIADILIEFESISRGELGVPKLIFKKRIFRESDESIMETPFLTLSFIQAQYDYRLGLYPVVYNNACQLCALELYSEFGANLPDDDVELTTVIERLTRKEIKFSRSSEEWMKDVLLRHSRLQYGSRQEARYHFLAMLRSLPYGSSIFFYVHCIDDPIGLLPPQLIIGINKRGLHFFRPFPKEYLHSVMIEDLMEFGSNNTTVFLKMNVASVLHLFQFRTSHGEAICVILQQHVNDLMTKRYLTTMENSQRVIKDVDTLPTVNFGPCYEQHLRATQTTIDEAEKTHEEMSRKYEELKHERDQTSMKLQETFDCLNSLKVESDVCRNQITEAEREVCNLGIELEQTERSLVTCRASLAEDESNIANFQALVTTADTRIHEVHHSIEIEKTKHADLMQQEAEIRSIHQKIEQIEVEKRIEVCALEKDLEDVKAEGLVLFSERDTKIASLVEQVANMTAMYHDSNRDIEHICKDQADVICLMKTKDETGKREREHAILIKKQATKIKQAEKMYKMEKVMRRRLHNRVEDLKGKIRVFARVRPMLSNEKDRGQQEVLSIPDELSISHSWKREGFAREYLFDRVFGPDESQDDVFKDTYDLIQSAIDGYNVCVFAYGQTGSGKTYTVYGNGKEPGLTPLGINKLFELLLKGSDKFYFSVSCYMVELYQDNLMDLLAPKNSKHVQVPKFANNQSLSEQSSKLKVRKVENDHLVRVEGLTTVEIRSAEELRTRFEEGQKYRHVASTEMNNKSSRSHLVMGVIIETTDHQTHVKTQGKLSFVDLAGSERVKKSGSTGHQLREAREINRSLSALGDVISALARGDPHIPYRNHKLTMLMSDSLGGNAKTLMFVNVSPTDANLDETQNSLQYATRVRTIKNEAAKDSNKEVVHLKKQIAAWKGLLSSPTCESEVKRLIQGYI